MWIWMPISKFQYFSIMLVFLVLKFWLHVTLLIFLFCVLSYLSMILVSSCQVYNPKSMQHLYFLHQIRYEWFSVLLALVSFLNPVNWYLLAFYKFQVLTWMFFIFIQGNNNFILCHCSRPELSRNSFRQRNMQHA